MTCSWVNSVWVLSLPCPLALGLGEGHAGTWAAQTGRAADPEHVQGICHSQPGALGMVRGAGAGSDKGRVDISPRSKLVRGDDDKQGKGCCLQW